MISYHFQWHHMISYYLISYRRISFHMIIYHKIRHVMIRHDMLWWRMVQNISKITFFRNCSAMLGICLGIITDHFEPLNKLNKFENFIFSKVVYRPVGYYLLSSLSIFSPEINHFEKSKQNIEIFFSHIHVSFSGILKDK